MLENSKVKNTKPFLVRFALLGITSRGMAVACQWFCVILTGFTIYLILNFKWLRDAAAVVPLYLKIMFGLSLLLAAPGYWLTIRWMDRNDAWPKRPGKPK